MPEGTPTKHDLDFSEQNIEALRAHELSLLDIAGNQIVTFKGITAPIDQLVQLCPVPKDQMEIGKINSWTANILQESGVELPPEVGEIVAQHAENELRYENAIETTSTTETTAEPKTEKKNDPSTSTIKTEEFVEKTNENIIPATDIIPEIIEKTQISDLKSTSPIVTPEENNILIQEVVAPKNDLSAIMAEDIDSKSLHTEKEQFIRYEKSIEPELTSEDLSPSVGGIEIDSQIEITDDVELTSDVFAQSNEIARSKQTQPTTGQELDVRQVYDEPMTGFEAQFIDEEHAILEMPKLDKATFYEIAPESYVEIVEPDMELLSEVLPFIIFENNQNNAELSFDQIIDDESMNPTIPSVLEQIVAYSETLDTVVELETKSIIEVVDQKLEQLFDVEIDDENRAELEQELEIICERLLMILGVELEPDVLKQFILLVKKEYIMEHFEPVEIPDDVATHERKRKFNQAFSDLPDILHPLTGYIGKFAVRLAA